MGYDRAFVLCEGSDDQKFVEQIVAPRLNAHFDLVKVVTYARKKKTKTESYVRNVLRAGDTVFFLTDFDAAPSISDRVATVRDTFGGVLDSEDVYVVVQEIESWYLAGLPRQHDVPDLGLPPPRTDDLTKEAFNALISGQASRVDVMVEVLKRYDLARGRSRNHSLAYFCTHVFDDLSS